jgi:hypothetical protein
LRTSYLPLNRRGKKTREWESVRRELKKRFAAVGITTCEIRLPQCWRDYGLTFAHGMKRDNLRGDELRKLVVLGCIPCHTAAEGMKESDMRKLVEKIIAARPVQP